MLARNPFPRAAGSLFSDFCQRSPRCRSTFTCRRFPCSARRSQPTKHRRYSRFPLSLSDLGVANCSLGRCRFGRKPLLIIGLIVYVAASIACASAASMSTIIFWRFIQALGGSVVPTAGTAMVRDLYDRNQSARVLSLNMVVTASAPIIAPLIGGQVLLWFDWRAIFWVLVIFGVVSLCAAFALPETLAPSRRNETLPVPT